MTRIIAILGIIFTAFAASAQARVEWVNTVDDFGTIHESDGKVALTFLGVNVGNEPLAILGAKSTCGCTTPVYPRTPIAPADTFAVTAAFDPAFQVGKITKKIYISTNASDEKSTLTVAGIVVPKSSTLEARFPIAVGSLRLEKGAVNIGKVLRGTTKLVCVDIYNGGDSAATLSFTEKPKFVTLSMAPKPLPPNEKGIITFYASAVDDDCWGSVADTTTVATSTGDAYRLPVVAHFIEDFDYLTGEQIAKAPILRVSDEVLPFGKLGDEKKTLTVTIENRGQSTMHIRRIFTSSPFVMIGKCKSKIKKGGSAELKVSVEPAIFADGCSMASETLTIIADDPTAPEAIVRITAEK